MIRLCQSEQDRGPAPGYAAGVRTLQTAALCALLFCSSARADVPQGWRVLTSSPESYQGQRLEQGARSGRGAGALRGESTAGASTYALLAQRISAVDYRGKRVKLTAYVQTKAVRGRAGLWLRVDDRQGETLAFSNMKEQPISGDQAWRAVSLELEVAPEAAELHFGLLLQGGGQAWIDDLSLQALGPTSPTAKARAKVRGLSRTPVNGDFER